MSEKRISGIPASNGIRFGKAFVYKKHSFDGIYQEKITTSDVQRELDRLLQAKNLSFQELEDLAKKTEQTLGKDKAAILQVQQEFLNDPLFFPAIQREIREQCYSAEKAVKLVTNHFIAQFQKMDNDYFRERATDIKDLGSRLITHLSDEQQPSLFDIKEESILVADDLTPSETVQLDKRFVLGFITKVGGKNSHTAILSRSLNIPAVLGAGDQMDQIHHGDMLILDGNTGTIIVHPEQETIKTYQEQMEKELTEKEKLQRFRTKKAITVDGFPVEVAANIGTHREASIAYDQGAEGIGLYRTEFLFINQEKLPTEEEQFEAYKEVAVAMKEKPVIIRTLDIGGDKDIPYLQLPKELNPFLGLRGIRLTLQQPDLFKTQLRAILRASVYGKIKIMFPMIASLEELQQAKTIIQEVQKQLKAEGIPFDENIPIGIMVEVPSAALHAEHLADEADFFSIGTNDLIQYTLAVDRTNEKVAELYDPFHPAVIRLIKMTIDAAHRKGKKVSMCGNMAGDPLAAPLLLGLGLDEWSMDPGAINQVKQVITKVTHQECINLTETILTLASSKDIHHTLIEFQKDL